MNNQFFASSFVGRIRFLERGADGVVRAVEAAAHVTVLHRDGVLETAGEAQHGRESSRMSAAASGTSSKPATRSSAPPGRDTVRLAADLLGGWNREFDQRPILRCWQTGRGGELRTAGGLMFCCVAEASVPVDLHNEVVCSIHMTRPHQRYAMQRRRTSRR